MRVFLIGFMGSGKSTVGRALARRLGLKGVDLDRAVERRAGKSVARIFREDGACAFRALERGAFRRARILKNAVVACGGGIVEDAAVRRQLARGCTVWLLATLSVCARRLGPRARRRPLWGDRPPYALYARRKRLYRSAARWSVETRGRSVAAVAARIAALLAARPG